MRILSDQFWFLFVMVVVAILVAVCAHVAARGRRLALMALGQRRGLAFDPDARACHHRFERFAPLGRGTSRRSSNCLSGSDSGGVYWEVFDYRYTAGSGKSRRTHSVGVIVATVPFAFPDLRIRPAGLFDRLAELAGFDDINFESEAFSRRYHVGCADRQRAFDILHPQMIEYLLTLPPMDWQLAGPHIVMTRSGTYSVDEIEARMEAIDAFVGHLPVYVKHDLAMS